VKRTFHFDFHKFFKLLGFHSIPKTVVIENVKYFEYNADILNKSWASEEWYAFWVYQILIVISKYQSNLNETCFAYFNTVAYGSYTMQPLTKTSVFRLEQIMNTEMNKKYLEYYKNTQEIELTKQLVERIKNSFKEHFLENKWLSQKTKEKALKKLNTMNITVGYKSVWQPDPTCDFKPDDGFGNYELYMNWYLEETIRYFSLGVPKTDVWMRGIDQDTFTVNASYNNNKNNLILPNAILQPPFVNIKKSMAYNLANIGIIIGHEMMHAFDEDGYKFNEKGEYDIWLTESEIKKYKEKQREIIKHYESMSHNDKIKMDPNLTLSENLADIGGFLIAENALIDYLNENKITGAELDTQLKEFYSFYAKEWRTINKPKFAESLINYDTHSFAKNRVNSVLAISPNFHRVFGIEKGHKLYSSMPNPLL
jgi:putative endopeptidase